jgi:RNA polymerase sigma factor (TIGR02999 family)
MPVRAVPEDITAWLVDHDVVPARKVDVLFEALYSDLRRRARFALRSEHGSTLNTTGLVNEAYLRLVAADDVEIRNRGHFLALASKTMRWVILDSARARLRQRRGGDVQHLPLDEALVMTEDRAEEILTIDAALARLNQVDPRLGDVVELRFFGGLSVEDTAEALDVSPRTVKRDWRKARAFLTREIAHESGADG